jgi:hypothetical protein
VAVRSGVAVLARLLPHDLGYADATRIGESLQAGGQVDAVAFDDLRRDDDVAEVDADAVIDPLFLREACVTRRHFAPDPGGCPQRGRGAREFDEKSVADRADDAALGSTDRH